MPQLSPSFMANDIFSITTLLSKINKTIIKFSKQMLLKHQEQQLLAQDIHSLCSHTSCPLKHIYNPLLVCPAEVNLQYTFPSGNSPRSIVKDGVIEPLPKSVYYILLMVSRLQWSQGGGSAVIARPLGKWHQQTLESLVHLPYPPTPKIYHVKFMMPDFVCFSSQALFF